MMTFNFGRIFLDLVWLLILLFLFQHFWKQRQVLLDAQGWLKAKGRVIYYKLIREGHTLWPKIEYEYCVYDKNLVGNYLFLDTIHNNPHSKYSRKVAYKAALAYKEDLEIEVYYNPNKPEESALDVSMPSKLTAILLVIGLLIVLHLVLITRHFI